MTIAIIDYNAGNTASVTYALGRLGVEPMLTCDAGELARAEKVIFPGVGEASTAMAFLEERGLDDIIRSLTCPVLGICLGMQLFCASSEENDTECIGIVPTLVKRFPSTDLKVPHIGWNRINKLDSVLFEGVDAGSHVYFVHSFFAEPDEYSTALTEYGSEFSAALERDNFYAVQFHPERSGTVGERILKNFLDI